MKKLLLFFMLAICAGTAFAQTNQVPDDATYNPISGFFKISGVDTSRWIYMPEVGGILLQDPTTALKFGNASALNFATFVNSSGRLVKIPKIFTDSATYITYNLQVALNHGAIFGQPADFNYSMLYTPGTSHAVFYTDGSGNTVLGKDTISYGTLSQQTANTAAIAGKADTSGSNINNVKRRLGKIMDVTFTSSSGSQFALTNPQTTFTFTSGGLTTSGGNNDLLNFASYTGYHTNASYWGRKMVFTPTADGNGLGIGIESTSTSVGKIVGRMIMTGANRGQLIISNYRASELVRAASATNLSYTNGQTIILLFQRNMMNYTLTAYISGNPASAVTVNYTDPLTYGNNYTVYQEGEPTIYHLGGSQTIISDEYRVDNFMQNDLLIRGNSITTGVYAGATDNMWANIIGEKVTNGYNLIAGGGNTTADELLLDAECLALKPKVQLYADGINDIVQSVPMTTIEANLATFAQRCVSNGIIPVFTTVLPLSTAYSGYAAYNANVVTLNSWITSSGYRYIDTYTAVVSGSVMNSSYNAGDGIHLNQAGNTAVANAVTAGLQGLVPMGNSSVLTQVSAGTATRLTVSSGSVNGLLTTYSTGYTAIPNYAGTTDLYNDNGGIVLTSNSSSSPVSVVAGGLTNLPFTGQRVADFFSTKVKVYGVPVIDTANVNTGYTGFSLKNTSTGSSAFVKTIVSADVASISTGATSSTAGVAGFSAGQSFLDGASGSLAIADESSTGGAISFLLSNSSNPVSRTNMGGVTITGWSFAGVSTVPVPGFNISTAQIAPTQWVNNYFQTKLTLTTTGSGAATLTGSTLNIPTPASGFTNPMTNAGDIITGGTSGAPGRLGIGGATQLLGVNIAGTALEYKSFNPSSPITLSATPGTYTIGFDFSQAYAWSNTNTFKNIYSTSATPTIAAGAAAGISPTVSIAGTNQDGIITITTGTATTTGVLCTVTMSGSFAYPHTCVPMLTNNSNTTAAIPATSIISTSPTSTTFQILIGTTALTASSQYVWNYHNGGN